LSPKTKIYITAWAEHDYFNKINMADLAKTIFWDYPMSSGKMRKLLASGTTWEKTWAASRLLERAPFAEIWKYLSYKQFLELYPKLKIRPQLKKVWDRALAVWESD